MTDVKLKTMIKFLKTPQGRIVIGLILMMFALLFSHYTTQYFLDRDGWHYWAETKEEFITDFISLAALFAGMYLVTNNVVKLN